MKGKAAEASSQPPLETNGQSLDEQGDPKPLAGRFAARNASSKYDFVKVKVWLGDNADHYYVLSRFLLSRMLTVTKIPNHVAIKIALELKKLLIDNSLLDVSQSDLEANLFKLMQRRGYGEEYINRYKMMTSPLMHKAMQRMWNIYLVHLKSLKKLTKNIVVQVIIRAAKAQESICNAHLHTSFNPSLSTIFKFHHQRVPLVILVCGTACAGKSTIATQLAQRLNLPNVLQTDMVYELLRTSTDAPLASIPVWARDFNSPEELITEFCRECRVVRKGLAGDLKKAMKDGKPIIIEGIHLDPSIYLMDEENRELTGLNTQDEKPKSQLGILDDNTTTSREFDSADASGGTNAHDIESCNSYLEMVGIEEGTAGDQVSEVTDCVASIELSENTSELQGKIVTVSETKAEISGKKDKPAAEPIIVPIVLRMADFDHKALLEEWISTRTFGDKCLAQDQDKLISNLKTIQDYLCTFESRGLTVVNISATKFPQTLDWLHSYLLQCIERGISPVRTETN